jgi:hypothetical protein
MNITQITKSADCCPAHVYKNSSLATCNSVLIWMLKVSLNPGHTPNSEEPVKINGCVSIHATWFVTFWGAETSKAILALQHACGSSVAARPKACQEIRKSLHFQLLIRLSENTRYMVITSVTFLLYFGITDPFQSYFYSVIRVLATMSNAAFVFPNSFL